MSAPAAWYIDRGGQEVGPHSVAQLRELVGSGQLQSTDLLLAEGSGDWVSAGSLPWLFPAQGIMAGSQLAPLVPSALPSGAEYAHVSLEKPGSPPVSVWTWVVCGAALLVVLVLVGLASITTVGSRATTTFTVVGASLSAATAPVPADVAPNPALDPKTQIRTAIRDYHKNKGEGYEIVAMNPPKKVQSKIDGKEVVMARVQHRGPTGEDGVEKPVEDHVLLIKYVTPSKVEVQMVKFEDWDEKKAQYGIEDEP